MDGSAGSVGRIMAALLGVPARHHSDLGRLGIAFQLANFIRDVREDTRLDRVYLPAEDRERFGVSEEDLAARRATPGGARAARARGRARPRPVRRRAAGDRRPRPPRCARACASPPASTAACSTASRRRASTCWARGPACACGTSRARRWRRCARDRGRGRPCAAPTRTPTLPARRRADLRRELRRARGRARARRLRRGRAGRRPLRDRRARHVGLRGADAVAARDGRRARDPAGDPVHGVPHAARLERASGCRGAGRASTTASSATRSASRPTRASRSPRSRPRDGDTVLTDRGNLDAAR